MFLRVARIDWATVISTIALVAFGVLMLSTTADPDTRGLENQAVQKAVLGALGLAVAVAMAQVDYRGLHGLAAPVYLLGVVALVLVLLVGDFDLGARRWFEVGPIVVQPSEFMKLAAIIAFAKFLSDRSDSTRSLRTVMVSLGVMLIPASLIFLQPDLGTALIFGAIWMAMVFVAGARWWHLLTPIIIALTAFPFAWFLAQDYMRQRFVTFLDPSSDPLGAGYNVLQARISIGSGGWFGHGLGQGSQSQLEFLRVRDTDFIFAMLGEQLGLAGTFGLLAFFTLLIVQALVIGLRARDPFGRLLAIGIAAMLFTQSFVNIGMNVGLMPVTGITLPLVSLGKNSLLVTLLSVGILLSIHSHRGAAPFRQQSMHVVRGSLPAAGPRGGPGR
ncbi:MAG: rod shape-determining protein RodA [Chloroflexi bacterium]|nr:rod shape-determining protein RodA [Chloroflexota bacterium]